MDRQYHDRGFVTLNRQWLFGPKQSIHDPDILVFEARPIQGQGFLSAITSSLWDIDTLTTSYHQLIARFEPLLNSDILQSLSPLEALIARLAWCMPIVLC